MAKLLTIFSCFSLFSVVLYGLLSYLGQVVAPSLVIPDRSRQHLAQLKTQGGPIVADGNDAIHRTYSFRDFRGIYRSIEYDIPKRHIQETEERYGFSEVELYEILAETARRLNASYRGKATITVKKDLRWRVSYKERYKHLTNQFSKTIESEIRNYRQRCMFVPEGPLYPDYGRIQEWQSGFVLPLYERLKGLGVSSGMNERDFISLLAKFVQHMPYKLPSQTPYYKGKDNNGFWPPIICLKEDGGDCDSKSTLFASLFYHFQRKACVLLLTERHAFIGIRNQHKIFPTDRYTRIGGLDYLLIEMTSPQEIGYVSPKEVSFIRSGKYKTFIFE